MAVAQCVGFIVIALNFLEHAGASDPVRRTNQRDSPSDLHCVVWGDGPYNGMKFHSEAEADEQFQKVKKEELVAVHYDKRFREVQRYQSHRVKAVRWHHLTEWCKENHDVQTEVGVGASGRVENFVAQSPPASLLSETTAVEGVRAASSLVGTIGVLEKEMTVLASKTSNLFKGIGQADPMSALKLGGADGKLKTRVSELERYVSTMFDTTKTLEEELSGAVGSSPPKSVSWKGKVSIKGKVDALLPKVDNLKKRVFALESSPVISELGKLESKVAGFKAKAASLVQSLGLESHSDVSAAPVTRDSPVNARVANLEQLIADVQRSTNNLGYEVLERSFAESTASARMGPLKVKVESLAAKVEDLNGRFTALESNSLKNVVDTLEDKIASLHSKVVEVSKRISEDAHLEYKETRSLPTKARVAALESYTSDAQQKLEALEVELLGSAKNMHESVAGTNSMKGKIISLAVKVDGLLDRVQHLEQEV